MRFRDIDKPRDGKMDRRKLLSAYMSDIKSSRVKLSLRYTSFYQERGIEDCGDVQCSERGRRH
jgi:hypothetical protein